MSSNYCSSPCVRLQPGKIPYVGKAVQKAIGLFWPDHKDTYDIWQLIVGEADVLLFQAAGARPGINARIL